MTDSNPNRPVAKVWNGLNWVGAAIDPAILGWFVFVCAFFGIAGKWLPHILIYYTIVGIIGGGVALVAGLVVRLKELDERIRRLESEAKTQKDGGIYQ